MLSKRFVILAIVVVASSTAFAQLSIAPVAAASDSPEAMALRAFHHAPMRRAGAAPAVSNGSTASYNWSGYAVKGSKFTRAKGSWIVPTANCSKSPNAWASFWVGIDGFASDTVEQAGTLIWCNKKTPTYYTWYEFYPAATTIISSIPTAPGDKISAEISYKGSEFTIEITDETTGQTFNISQAVSGAKRTSAEWVAEAPSAITGILNLADFSTASFGDDYTDITGTSSATDTTVSGPISDFGSAVEKITMVDDTSYKEATPSALSTDGSSFTVKWIEYN